MVETTLEKKPTDVLLIDVKDASTIQETCIIPKEAAESNIFNTMLVTMHSSTDSESQKCHNVLVENVIRVCATLSTNPVCASDSIKSSASCIHADDDTLFVDIPINESHISIMSICDEIESGLNAGNPKTRFCEKNLLGLPGMVETMIELFPSNSDEANNEISTTLDITLDTSQFAEIQEIDMFDKSIALENRTEAQQKLSTFQAKEENNPAGLLSKSERAFQIFNENFPCSLKIAKEPNGMNTKRGEEVELNVEHQQIQTAEHIEKKEHVKDFEHIDEEKLSHEQITMEDRTKEIKLGPEDIKEDKLEYIEVQVGIECITKETGHENLKENQLSLEHINWNIKEHLGPEHIKVKQINEEQLWYENIEEMQIGREHIKEEHLGPEYSKEEQLGQGYINEEQLGLAQLADEQLKIESVGEEPMRPEHIEEKELGIEHLNKKELGQYIEEEQQGPENIEKQHLGIIEDKQLGKEHKRQREIKNVWHSACPKHMEKEQLGHKHIEEEQLGLDNLKKDPMGSEHIEEKQTVSKHIQKRQLGPIKVEHLVPKYIEEEQLGNETIKKELRPEHIKEEQLGFPNFKEKQLSYEHMELGTVDIKETKFGHEKIKEEQLDIESIEMQIGSKHMEDEQPCHTQDWQISPKDIEKKQFDPEHIGEDQLGHEHIDVKKLIHEHIGIKQVAPEYITEEDLVPDHIKRQQCLEQHLCHGRIEEDHLSLLHVEEGWRTLDLREIKSIKGESIHKRKKMWAADHERYLNVHTEENDLTFLYGAHKESESFTTQSQKQEHLTAENIVREAEHDRNKATIREHNERKVTFQYKKEKKLNSEYKKEKEFAGNLKEMGWGNEDGLNPDNKEREPKDNGTPKTALNPEHNDEYAHTPESNDQKVECDIENAKKTSNENTMIKYSEKQLFTSDSIKILESTTVYASLDVSIPANTREESLPRDELLKPTLHTSVDTDKASTALLCLDSEHFINMTTTANSNFSKLTTEYKETEKFSTDLAARTPTLINLNEMVRLNVADNDEMLYHETSGKHQ